MPDRDVPTLPPPARYFPLDDGKYRVEPALSKFGHPFGNGAADPLVFQFDREFDAYRKVKLAARAERLDKYFQTHCFTGNLAAAAAKFIFHRLTSEHPRLFGSG